MKYITLSLFTLFITLTVYGQNITGQWNGILKVQGTQLRVVFNITKIDNEYSATMDSPDQGAKGIPVTSTSFENSILTVEITNASIHYKGTLTAQGSFIGTFKQGNSEFPMNLSRKSIEKEAINRPQEPTKPYPYYSENVTFKNTKANISLAGTLNLPKKEGYFPVVILITGSGAQNRDEELLGHKPFLVIADYLTKKGVAVLRYDDRGTAKSTGDFSTATSADFATDVESAIAYLKTRKEINQNKIGLIGHSEGGIIAPMVASKSKDVAFIVLLAGTGIQGDQLLLLQQKLIGKLSGISDEDLQENELTNRKIFDMVNKSKNTEQLNIDLTNHIKQSLIDSPNETKPRGMSDDEFVKLQVQQITNPWMQFFIKYNPLPALEKVKCPVLALNGEKDIQVPSKINLEAIEEALEKSANKNVTIKELPNLNHLFQECKTGSPSEYATIEQTISPIALTELSNWILKQLN